jgi:hypothetical protein
MGLDVRGFVYNYGRTKPPAIPQLLKKGTLSVRKNMDTTIDTYVATIKQTHGAEWKRYAKTIYRTKLLELRGRDGLWFRRERMPVEKHKIAQALREFLVTTRQIEGREKPSLAPRSYFYNCRRFCDYHELCVSEYEGLNIKPLMKAAYQVVPEPYEEDHTVDLLKEG